MTRWRGGNRSAALFAAALGLGSAISSCGGSTSAGTVAAGGGASGTGGGGGGGQPSGGAGGQTHVFDACKGPGDCVLGGKGCCASCDPSTADVDGVARGHEADHEAAVCSMMVSCGACPDHSPGPAHLAAFCESDVCVPIDVRTDPVSACASDSDCLLRGPGCCEPCATPAEQLLALSITGDLTYHAQVCPSAPPTCDLCLPVRPPGTKAVCGSDHHCRVAVTELCPVAPPPNGGACSLGDAVVCEYGQDLRTSCRTQATCHNGVFEVKEPACPPLPEGGQSGCPLATSANGSACAADGQLCDLHGGAMCLCTQCPGGPCMLDAHWACSTPQAECPSVAPDLGQQCPAMEGVMCTYGTCGGPGGASRGCQGGVWVDVPRSCPV